MSGVTAQYIPKWVVRSLDCSVNMSHFIDCMICNVHLLAVSEFSHKEHYGRLDEANGMRNFISAERMISELFVLLFYVQAKNKHTTCVLIADAVVWDLCIIRFQQGSPYSACFHHVYGPLCGSSHFRRSFIVVRAFQYGHSVLSNCESNLGKSGYVLQDRHHLVACTQERLTVMNLQLVLFLWCWPNRKRILYIYNLCNIMSSLLVPHLRFVLFLSSFFLCSNIGILKT